MQLRRERSATVGWRPVFLRTLSSRSRGRHFPLHRTWYNRARRHSTLGYRSPAQDEAEVRSPSRREVWQRFPDKTSS